MMPVREPRRDLHGALEPRKAREQARAIAPPDPEADHVAREAADPADRDQRPEREHAGGRRIAGEQRHQQAVRRRKCEHEAVGRVAVLADELEKRRKVGRIQDHGYRDSIFPAGQRIGRTRARRWNSLTRSAPAHRTARSAPCPVRGPCYPCRKGRTVMTHAFDFAPLLPAGSPPAGGALDRIWRSTISPAATTTRTKCRSTS